MRWLGCSAAQLSRSCRSRRSGLPSKLMRSAHRAGAMRRASAARVEHENRIGAADRDLRDWYAAYMVAEQAGTELPR